MPTRKIDTMLTIFVCLVKFTISVRFGVAAMAFRASPLWQRVPIEIKASA